MMHNEDAKRASVERDPFSLAYPIIRGKSERGGLFRPAEIGKPVMLQMFSNDSEQWRPRWLEINGHVVALYASKEVASPSVWFDLKEVVLFRAARGIPNRQVDHNVPILAIVSRFHRNAVTGASVFFVQCETMTVVWECLAAYRVNREWALRFSALFYPRGSASVSYTSKDWKVNVASVPKTVLNSHRHHAKTMTEGYVEKQGERFGSRFHRRFVAVRGDMLDYYDAPDGALKGTVELRDAEVIVICNGFPTRTSTVALPKILSQGAAEQTDVRENWFGITSGLRTFVFRAPDTDTLEQWCVSLRTLSSIHASEDGMAESWIEAAEQQFRARPSGIRYMLHLSEPERYSKVKRQPMQGRRTSGNFEHTVEPSVESRESTNAFRMALDAPKPTVGRRYTRARPAAGAAVRPSSTTSHDGDDDSSSSSSRSWVTFEPPSLDRTRSAMAILSVTHQHEDSSNTPFDSPRATSHEGNASSSPSPVSVSAKKELHHQHQQQVQPCSDDRRTDAIDGSGVDAASRGAKSGDGAGAQSTHGAPKSGGSPPPPKQSSGNNAEAVTPVANATGRHSGRMRTTSHAVHFRDGGSSEKRRSQRVSSSSCCGSAERLLQMEAQLEKANKKAERERGHRKKLLTAMQKVAQDYNRCQSELRAAQQRIKELTLPTEEGSEDVSVLRQRVRRESELNDQLRVRMQGIKVECQILQEEHTKVTMERQEWEQRVRRMTDAIQCRDSEIGRARALLKRVGVGSDGSADGDPQGTGGDSTSPRARVSPGSASRASSRSTSSRTSSRGALTPPSPRPLLTRASSSSRNSTVSEDAESPLGESRSQRKEATALRKRIASMIQEAKLKDKRIQELTEQLAEVSQQQPQHQQHHNAHGGEDTSSSEEIATLKQQLLESVQREDKHFVALTGVQEELRVVQEDLQETLAREEAACEVIVDLQSQLELVSTQLLSQSSGGGSNAELQAHLSQMHDSLKDGEAELSRLQQELGQEQAKCARQARQIQELEVELEEMEIEVSASRESLSQAQAAADREVERLQQLVTELQASLGATETHT